MPTFGNSATTGTASNTAGSGQIQVSSFVLSDNNASVSKLSAVFTGGASNQVVRCVIYTDSAGSPDALVAVTNEVTITAGLSKQAVDFPFAVNASLNAGTYWLGEWFGATGSNSTWGADSVANALKYKTGITYSSSSDPPTPFPSSPSSYGANLEIVGTYTIGSSGNTYTETGFGAIG